MLVLYTATSADIERIFSRGRLVLLHIHNGMSGRSIRALLCLSDWVKLDLVRSEDVVAVTAQTDDGAKDFVRNSTVIEIE